MTRSKRREAIGLRVILLLLAGLGFLAYKFYLSTRSYALQRVLSSRATVERQLAGPAGRGPRRHQ